MLIAFIARRGEKSIFKRKKRDNLKAIAVNNFEMSETMLRPF